MIAHVGVTRLPSYRARSLCRANQRRAKQRRSSFPLSRLTAWARRHPLICFGLAGAWFWACADAYLIAFCERLGAEPEQLGISRTDVLARAETAGFILLAGLTLLACALLGAIGPYLAIRPLAARLRGSRRLRWLTHQSTRQMFELATIGLAVAVVATLPPALMASGSRAARDWITEGKDQSSLLQFAFDVRAEPATVMWIGSAESPLLSRDDKPISTALALVMGESNGVTYLFNFEDCEVVHAPSSLIAVRLHVVDKATETSALPRCGDPHPG